MRYQKQIATAALALATFSGVGADYADWTTVDLTNSLVTGQLDGVSVSFFANGDTNLQFSVLNGSETQFGCGAATFSPPAAFTDAIYVAATPTPRRYTFTFGAPIRNPKVHLASFASVATFSQGVRKLSGETFFTVAQNTVSGTADNPGVCNNDQNGSIQVDGVFCSLEFELRYANSIDGIYIQLGGTVVPQPRIVISLATDSVQLTFPTEIGLKYQVQYSSELPAIAWTDFGAPILGDGTNKTVLVSTSGADARFFRILLLICFPTQ